MAQFYLFFTHSLIHATNIFLSTQPSPGIGKGTMEINKTHFLLLGAHHNVKSLKKLIEWYLEK